MTISFSLYSKWLSSPLEIHTSSYVEREIGLMSHASIAAYSNGLFSLHRIHRGLFICIESIRIHLSNELHLKAIGTVKVIRQASNNEDETFTLLGFELLAGYSIHIFS